MNKDLLKELAENFIKKQDIYSWLKLYSVQIWNKIGFVRSRKGLKISETTITQNLVFDFWQLATVSQFPIEIYESKNEKANGNDLEICIETNKGYILFPCQAKIIYKNSRYNSLYHQNRSSLIYQMDMLISYANRNKGIPIYLLYNNYNNLKRCQEIEQATGFPIDYYGCSVIGAKYIKAKFNADRTKGIIKNIKYIPSFDDLHPFVASTFQDFLKDLQEIYIENWLFENKYSPKDIRFYNRKEITSPEQWENMAPLPAIGFVESNKKKILNVLNKDLSGSIKPKFRILFLKKKRELEIIVQR